MNVLVIGSGGREHALCWALSASPLLDRLHCLPGNAGIAELASCVAIDPFDFASVARFCQTEAISLVVVGPEAPLVAGLADHLRDAGIRVFGPSAKAAMLEGSKGYMKDLCARHGIPTAAYGRFDDLARAEAFIEAHGAPIVIKADGLAAGKGVVVAESVDEAQAAAREMLGGRFGAAGASLVIEEYLDGEEVSFFALVDGRHALPLAAAQDHKRAFDGDQGPNTGGMGAYSPAPSLTPALEREVMERIVRPTVAAMLEEGAPFVGVLFAGLMLTADGPKLLEYNVRFGDPEAQVLTRRLRSDLLPAFIAACDGTLDRFDLRWSEETALCVVLAAQGYPEKPARGSEIRNLERAAAIEDVVIFHAGTRREGTRLIADGGRVLNVTATGRDAAEARARAYRAVDLVDWPGGFCRRDIGWRALAHG
ncbi:MAG: phosphoribosylamine--glycine ligase [Alphaproteobacteria bacterium]|nr:phosphoribosylamine--glycine ligase [Alphaproteobacteria bacterium]